MFHLILGCILWCLGMFAYNALIVVIGTVASGLTGSADLRNKLDKEDPKRFMPRELLEKPNVQ